MKIILSRKGFDSSNGGCASPIMSDNTMLSMPIPSSGDKDRYEDLEYKNISYSELLKQLNPKGSYANCHVDPDLRGDIRKNPIDGWTPAFGQIGTVNSYLSNCGVCEGDLFLFFGWYRRVINDNGKYRYAEEYDRKENKDFTFYDFGDLNVVWGYLQIGKIITKPEEIKKYGWHPHSSDERTKNRTNALYIPTERLSLNENLPGCGTLNYRQDRVLTMQGKSRANWIPYEFMMPDRIYSKNGRKNLSTCGGLYYGGIWQEIVLKESAEAENWAKVLLS